MSSARASSGGSRYGEAKRLGGLEMHLMDFASKAFQLRAARSDDFRFAWSLYKELMEPLTIELLGRWNETAQKQVVELPAGGAVADLLVQLGIPSADVGVIIVNGASGTAKRQLRERDAVTLIPIIGGG